MNKGDVARVCDTTPANMWKQWDQEIVLVLKTKENMGLSANGEPVEIPVALCLVNGTSQWFPNSVLQHIDKTCT